uniref:PH domain-containing protein n=1 Tax=Timema douglasi TaxID=61478 RepID=A0A7R8ZA01_TIMDO|nr:unnamed protein product [Timema douglasi]
MSSVKSSSSTGEKDSEKIDRRDDVIKMGYLKKWKVGNNVTQNFKTLRKKFFVLRADPSDSSDSSARLEYYDSEKKWKSHHAPKRTIRLKTCFNINRRLDKKHKHVIALYTKDDCFCLVLESEEDLEAWLKALLSLQHGEEIPDGEQPKPTFVAGARQKWQSYLETNRRGKETDQKNSKRKSFTEEIDELKAKKQRLQAVVDTLIKSADRLSEQAETTGNLTFMSKSDSFRRTSREKTAALADINKQLIS